MLNQLLSLYKKHRSATPLEDFTTEALVGVIKNDFELKEKFCADFLKLRPSNYYIHTQKKYVLADRRNCIVDIVIESDDCICFIENKVNSPEGDNQLDRYGYILDKFKEIGYRTYFFYCTKFKENKKYKKHNFKNITWYEVSLFLKKFPNNDLSNEFTKFLNMNKISQNLNITAQDFISFENFQRTYNLINSYLNHIKPIFLKSFSKKKLKITDGLKFAQLRDHNRSINYLQNVINHSGYSEIKYGFRFDGPFIFTGIFVNKANKEYHKVVELSKSLDTEKFEIKIYSFGISINLMKNISIFINDDNGPENILTWFKESFETFSKLISNYPNIDWIINIDDIADNSR